MSQTAQELKAEFVLNVQTILGATSEFRVLKSVPAFLWNNHLMGIELTPVLDGHDINKIGVVQVRVKDAIFGTSFGHTSIKVYDLGWFYVADKILEFVNVLKKEKAVTHVKLPFGSSIKKRYIPIEPAKRTPESN